MLSLGFLIFSAFSFLLETSSNLILILFLSTSSTSNTLNLDFPKGDYEFTYQAYKSFIDKYKQDYYDIMDGIKRR